MQKKKPTNKHCSFEEKEQHRQEKLSQSRSFQIFKKTLEKRNILIHSIFSLIPALILLNEAYSVTKTFKKLINPDISLICLVYYLSLGAFIALIVIIICLLVIIVTTLINILKTKKSQQKNKYF